MKTPHLEQLNEEAVQKTASQYLKGKYAPYLKSLDNSPLAKVRPITAHDYAILGQILENHDNIFMPRARMQYGMNEADGSIAALGVYPNVALDVLAVAYGTSVINLIASTQPIKEPHGTVYFRDFQAQNTRGNVTAGQNIFSTLSAPDVFPDGYASDTFVNTTFENDGSPATPATYTATALSSEDFGAPVNPQTMVISGSIVTNHGTATLQNVIPNPSTGIFSGAASDGTNIVTLYGTVNFTNGTVTSEVLGGGSTLSHVTLSAYFQTIEEANTDLQKAIPVLVSKLIQARFYALKSTLGMQERYMMEQRFGVSLEEEIANDLTAAINNEIVNQAVKLIATNIPTSNQSTTIYRQPQAGVSLLEHKQAVVDALEDANSQLLVSAGRGSVNCWIAGRRSAAVLKSLEGRFEKSSGANDLAFGPTLYGTLDGVPVVRVPFDAVLDQDTVLGICKSDRQWEAPIVYAPYMPLVVTPTQPYGFNPLQMQRACAVWAGLDSLIPNLSTQLTINQTGNTYGAAT